MIHFSHASHSLSLQTNRSINKYINTFQALSSQGVAGYDNDSAYKNLLNCHPFSPCPNVSVKPSVDYWWLYFACELFLKARSFKTLCTTFVGCSYWYNCSCCCDYLLYLTRLMNHLLSGKALPCLAPWVCGAPLTALVKRSGGVRPIAVSGV